MAAGPDKGALEKKPGAFRTIGELAQEIGRPQHILRYWETRFPQLKPLQRAGGRRYYRPDDVALVRRIDALLAKDGYTIRGVQRLLAAEAPASGSEKASLKQVRDALAKALKDDQG
ncbi:MerR family transcriptional regulator [Sphingomonas sp. MG17]|jgi:DNA-binding transcriptional MerR regulator|uniref:MerR family transcriptional regulator n=1 Tax=Sphingomonas tagetis TaxID=2949092 RepID=A0A9X2HJS7_9SPHN|nr:MerR family transcriptional regulator [Sphingomonas tagetis]MCP3730394.1 MerR family transcriptional regulator [Sphingomonas tagetis]